MANVIRIKRSSTSGSPASLADGELAYSSLADNGANGGDRLYVGMGGSIYTIGGKFFTDAITNATNANTASTIVKRDASGNFSAGTISAALSGNASTATSLATGRTIAITGDIAYTSPSFDGTGNVTAAGTLATLLDGTANKVAGTFGSSTAIPVVTVDVKGRITSITTSAISTTINLAGTSGTGSVNGGGTLTFSGGQGISTSVNGSAVTISANPGYTTTVTAAGTTTLTSSSTGLQYFTGTSTQTVQLPVTSTLSLGDSYTITNLSTSAVTVQSSGANSIVVVGANQRVVVTCISITGITASSWSSVFDGSVASTGTGSLVFGSSPTLTTPIISTITNTGTITIPTTTGTLALQGDSTFIGTTQVALNRASSNLALTGILSVTLPGSTSGTVQLIPNAVAGTGTVLTLPDTTDTLIGKATSDSLTNKTYDTGGTGNVFKINGTQISAVTGSGSAVLAISPSLTTPTLGVAAATSINKVTITTPATGSTLTIADGKTLTVNNTVTFSGTDASTVTFGSGGTVTYTSNNLSVFATTTSSQLAGVISDETGTGSLVFANTPSLTTPSLGVATATSITASTNGLSLAAASGNNNVTLTPTGTGTVDVSSKRITNVAAPSSSTDAANKGYVDGVVSGLNIHSAVDVLADSTNTQVTGGVYASGTTDTSGGLGIGATLTDATAGQVLLIDGYTVASGDRVLVNSFTGVAATKNGIYTLTTVGVNGSTKWVLTRATDYNNSASAQVDPGDFVFIYRGTTYAKTGWVQTTVGTSNSPAETIVIGTDQILWTQFSGAGTYTAGTGLTLTGGVFSVNAAQTGITQLGTITSGTWNGTVIGPTYGGTGVNNGSSTLTLAGNVSHAGAFTQTFTATANTSLTLPTTGTLATLSGSETLTNKTITSPTINGGSHTAITSFALRDTSAAFDVTLAASSSTALSAARTLTLDMVNAARTISLGGNLSLAANLTTSGANALTLTTTGITNVTLPTTGTLATLTGAETLTTKTITGSSIGSANPSTGAFTSLSANSTVSFTGITDATALGTAAVILSGGLSVAKTMYIGTNITGAGAATSTLDGFLIDGGTY